MADGTARREVVMDMPLSSAAVPTAVNTRTTIATPTLFISLFAILSFLMLRPVHDDHLHIFPGFFHLMLRLERVDPQPLANYLAATCVADTSCSDHDHGYPVRFVLGLAYPVMATLYAGCAEAFRRLLGDGVPYVEILIRAGSAVSILHWLLVVFFVRWALWRFRDPALRAKVATAALVAVCFDYFVNANRELFTGHALFNHLNNGYGYAMTLWPSRAAVALLMGFYVAARLLGGSRSRLWLVPIALCFHLGVATMTSVALFVAEITLCIVRRRFTKDLLVLGLCSVVGVVAAKTVGMSGYVGLVPPALPIPQILHLVWSHAATYPLPKYFVLLTLGGLSSVLGIALARRWGREDAAVAGLIAAAMVGMLLVQTATVQAAAAGLFNWHTDPIVHMLMWMHVYASSAVALGLSLWAFVRGGEWLARRVRGVMGPYGATAFVASVTLLSVVGGVAVSSRTRDAHVYTLRPPYPVAEPIRQLIHPNRSVLYSSFVLGSPTLGEAAWGFSDRILRPTASWYFNVVTHLRGLHQLAVLGPAAEQVASDGRTSRL
jgi:hypothetical protein